MNCPNCSYELADRTKFCVRCGWAKGAESVEPGSIHVQQARGPESAAQRGVLGPSGKAWWPKALAVFVLLLMVLGVATWYAMKSANPFKESALSRPGGNSSAISANDAGVAEDVNRAISAQTQAPETNGNPVAPAVNEAVPEVSQNGAVAGSENDVTEIAPPTQNNTEAMSPRSTNKPEALQSDRRAIY